MDRNDLVSGIRSISQMMSDSESMLVELDARFGDGDLGISMKRGFERTVEYLNTAQEEDLGQLLRKCASEFNEAAPSTMGTIISFGFMGMARKLKGSKEVSLEGLADAMSAGVQMIMDKAKSRPGDKTILDSIYPGTKALKEHAAEGKKAWEKAYEAARQGMENTRNMKGKHGRIAYYGDKTLGEVDGGAVVGMLIFKALK